MSDHKGLSSLDSERFAAEPKDVLRTLKAYCELKKIDEKEASRILNKNAQEFFDLVR